MPALLLDLLFFFVACCSTWYAWCARSCTLQGKVELVLLLSKFLLPIQSMTSNLMPYVLESCLSFIADRVKAAVEEDLQDARLQVKHPSLML